MKGKLYGALLTTVLFTCLAASAVLCNSISISFSERIAWAFTVLGGGATFAALILANAAYNQWKIQLKATQLDKALDLARDRLGIFGNLRGVPNDSPYPADKIYNQYKEQDSAFVHAIISYADPLILFSDLEEHLIPEECDGDFSDNDKFMDLIDRAAEVEVKTFHLVFEIRRKFYEENGIHNK